VRLSTEVADQSSLQSVIVSTDVMSDHIGRRDAACTQDSCHVDPLRAAAHALEYIRDGFVCRCVNHDNKTINRAEPPVPRLAT